MINGSVTSISTKPVNGKHPDAAKRVIKKKKLATISAHVKVLMMQKTNKQTNEKRTEKRQKSVWS